MDLKAIMMGGVLPSILLGTSTVLMKFSFKKGISLSAYITVVGGTVLLYGLTAMLINGKGALNAVSTTYAVGMGVL
ncbi:MAG: hypothetical protein H6715_06250 [Myxococcales bacterium]|nr:hypothetical protein [Myxococcales bacterium]